MAVVSDHQRTPPERTEIKGWSKNAARRNRSFLQSIDPKRLSGIPIAFTLTLRDCPPSAADMAKLVDKLRKRLVRMGAVFDHWVIEWQRRGVPHLHGLAYFDAETVRNADRHASSLPPPVDRHEVEELHQYLSERLCRSIIDGWLQIAAPFKAGYQSQHAEPLWGINGWLAYMSKHSSRGVEHYQRQRDSLPQGWHSSGRLWGKGGDWPTLEVGMTFDRRSGFRLRRALRAYARAKARDQLRLGLVHRNQAQIAAAKRSLRYLSRSGHSKAETKREKRRWSELRGVNLFVPGDIGRDLVEWAMDHDTGTVTDAETIVDSVKTSS